MNQIIRYSAIAVFLLCTAVNALAVDCFVQTYPATPGTTVVNVANEYCTDVQAWFVGTDMNVACAPNNSWHGPRSANRCTSCRPGKITTSTVGTARNGYFPPSSI
jgi:hypothetical protein